MLSLTAAALLVSRKAILDVLCQQGDLVYARAPVLKARLFLWHQWSMIGSTRTPSRILKGTYSTEAFQA